MCNNESLANFACSSSTEEYWPSVIFVRASGKCSLVWPSGLDSKKHTQYVLNENIIPWKALEQFSSTFCFDLKTHKLTVLSHLFI